jgi:uncharacterized protein (TIGR00661 family)
MRVLYGVAGEGLGHAIRSAVVRDHLVAQGHDVTFACAKSRASRYLAGYGPVLQAAMFGNVIRSNKIQPLRTLFANLGNVGLAVAAPAMWSTLPRFDFVISDFEPCVARYAGLHGIPLLAIDNMHFLSRCAHSPGMVDRLSAGLAMPVVSRIIPNAQRYFVTSFVDAPVGPKTSLFLPILRDEVFSRAGDSEDGPIVVYFNDKADWGSIMRSLGAMPFEFAAFGAPPGAPRHANVKVHEVGSGLMDAIARAPAVISGAGFGLMTECIYTHKPLLALPCEGHFEQILNANYLQALGFGKRARALTPETVGSFLGELPRFKKALAGVTHDRNRGLFAELDRVLS